MLTEIKKKEFQAISGQNHYFHSKPGPSSYTS